MPTEIIWIKVLWLLIFLEMYHPTQAKVIIQSSKCSLKDIKRKLQCFKEIPQQKYEAVVNDTVVMRCIVENQHGRVQWRAKELTMGFDRAIPAMPRFRITGEASKSEYFLTIQPIQFSDNGDYECQVEPIKHHPLLRRRTHLFVYRRPSFPQIWYQYQNVSFSKILIDPHQNCISLECMSEHGYPVPKFSWRIGSTFFNMSQCGQGRDTRPEVVQERSVSFFSVSPKQLEDNQVVECQITNRALDLKSEQTFLKTNVQILFQRLPGLPKSQFKNVTVSDREPLKVDCSISPPGLPRAHLVWKWADKAMRHIPVQFFNLQSYSVVKFSAVKVVNILTIPYVSTEMHAQMLLCESVYRNQSTATTSVLLLVTFLPKQLEVFLSDGPLLASSDQKDFSICPMREWEVYFFKCKTSPYYGNYSLVWNIQQNFQQFPLPNDKYLVENKHLYTQVSSIELKVNRTMHSSILICSMGPGGDISASIHIDVLYLPNTVTISSSYSNQDTYLTIGDVVEVNCSVADGNPIPELSMYLDSAMIEKTQFSRKEISVKLVMERNHDQSRVYCQAKNQHFFHTTIQSRFINLSLALLPRLVTMKFLYPSNGIVESGQRQIISCNVIGSNPEPTISWKLRLCQTMTKHFTEIKENCQLQDIKTVNSNFSFVNHKESQLTSVMTWQPTWLYHKSTVICKVYNYHFPQNIIRKKLKINVIFKPKIFVYQREKNMKIIKGENKTFIIDIAANPEEKLICLNSSGTVVLLRRIPPFYSKWLFSITKAKGTDQGRFILVAVNKLGDTNYTFYITVLDSSPEAKKESVLVYLSSLSNTLSCSPQIDVFQGNVSFSWSLFRLDKQFKELVLKCNQGLHYTNETFRYLKLFVKCKREESTSLIFYYINHDDNGRYVCNTLLDGNVVASTIFISVILAKPSIVKYDSVKKFGCDIFSNCSLSCYFTNYGGAKIEWYQDNSHNSSILFSTNITSNFSDIQETILEISNISYAQYGRYICKIINSIGSDVWSVYIVEPTSPEKPIECRMQSVENTFVNLTWRPGFNGGRPQIFKIQWITDGKSEASWNTEFIKPLKPIQDLNYLIKDLSPNTSYSVRISASNVFGESGHCTFSFQTKSFSLTFLPSSKSGYDQQYLKVLAYTLAICSVTILLIIIITGSQKLFNIIRDRRSQNQKSMSRFISLNNRLYSSMMENDKDISMIFTNRGSSSFEQSRRNLSGNTSLVNISDQP